VRQSQLSSRRASALSLRTLPRDVRGRYESRRGERRHVADFYDGSVQRSSAGSLCTANWTMRCTPSVRFPTPTPLSVVPHQGGGPAWWVWLLAALVAAAVVAGSLLIRLPAWLSTGAARLNPGRSLAVRKRLKARRPLALFYAGLATAGRRRSRSRRLPSPVNTSVCAARRSTSVMRCCRLANSARSSASRTQTSTARPRRIPSVADQPSTNGRFHVRAFTRDTTWHVAIVYQPDQ